MDEWFEAARRGLPNSIVIAARLASLAEILADSLHHVATFRSLGSFGCFACAGALKVSRSGVFRIHAIQPVGIVD